MLNQIASQSDRASVTIVAMEWSLMRLIDNYERAPGRC
jgi:hypothetical protein